MRYGKIFKHQSSFNSSTCTCMLKNYTRGTDGTDCNLKTKNADKRKLLISFVAQCLLRKENFKFYSPYFITNNRLRKL